MILVNFSSLKIFLKIKTNGGIMVELNSILTITNFTLYGFSYLDFSENNLISRVLIGWDNFLQEDYSYKDLWGYDLENFDPNIGYDRQDEELEIFNAKSKLEELVKNNDFDFEKYKQWLSDLRFLRESCTDYCLSAAKALCKHLNKDFSILEKSFRDDNNHILQLAKYPYNDSRYLVKPHQDESFLTMYLYENFSGLMFDKNCNIPHLSKPNKALVFLGTGAESFCKELTAMTHVIKNNFQKKSLSLSFYLNSSSL
jgi:isopenicillin N synthase-like dioxygenase